jgi:hypothetical protein
MPAFAGHDGLGGYGHFPTLQNTLWCPTVSHRMAKPKSFDIKGLNGA